MDHGQPGLHDVDVDQDASQAHKLDQQYSDIDTCQERQQVSMLSISEDCSIDCGRWPPYVHSSMRLKWDWKTDREVEVRHSVGHRGPFERLYDGSLARNLYLCIDGSDNRIIANSEIAIM
jgi:hypothetical protein